MKSFFGNKVVVVVCTLQMMRASDHLTAGPHTVSTHFSSLLHVGYTIQRKSTQVTSFFFLINAFFVTF